MEDNPACSRNVGADRRSPETIRPSRAWWCVVLRSQNRFRQSQRDRAPQPPREAQRPCMWPTRWTRHPFRSNPAWARSSPRTRAHCGR